MKVPSDITENSFPRSSESFQGYFKMTEDLKTQNKEIKDKLTNLQEKYQLMCICFGHLNQNLPDPLVQQVLISNQQEKNQENLVKDEFSKYNMKINQYRNHIMLNLKCLHTLIQYIVQINQQDLSDVPFSADALYAEFNQGRLEFQIHRGKIFFFLRKEKNVKKIIFQKKMVPTAKFATKADLNELKEYMIKRDDKVQQQIKEQRAKVAEKDEQLEEKIKNCNEKIKNIKNQLSKIIETINNTSLDSKNQLVQLHRNSSTTELKISKIDDKIEELKTSINTQISKELSQVIFVEKEKIKQNLLGKIILHSYFETQAQNIKYFQFNGCQVKYVGEDNEKTILLGKNYISEGHIFSFSFKVITTKSRKLKVGLADRSIAKTRRATMESQQFYMQQFNALDVGDTVKVEAKNDQHIKYTINTNSFPSTKLKKSNCFWVICVEFENQGDTIEWIQKKE